MSEPWPTAIPLRPGGVEASLAEALRATRSLVTDGQSGRAIAETRRLVAEQRAAGAQPAVVAEAELALAEALDADGDRESAIAAFTRALSHGVNDAERRLAALWRVVELISSRSGEEHAASPAVERLRIARVD